MSRYRWIVVNVVLGALVIGAVPELVAAGNGVGAVFNLGVKNTVGAITKLVATTSNAALLVQNAGTGPGLQITVGAGKAPIIVSAGAGKATNLNADLLDGNDSSAFQGKLTKLIDLNGLPCGSGGSGQVLAIDSVDCVTADTEPNNTMNTALSIGHFSESGTVGPSDDDWYTLLFPNCTATDCAITLKLDSAGAQMDVYQDVSVKASNVTTFDNVLPFNGGQPTFHVRIHASTQQPYVLHTVPS